MGLKSSTIITASYKLPTLKEPYKSKMEMLPKKYLQTELSLENESFMGKSMPNLSPEEKIANARARGESIDKIKAIEHIVSSSQPKTIEIGKQNKHIPGTNEFRQKQIENQRKGLKKPGTILFPANEAQKLVNSLHGTGTPIISESGKFMNKEYVRSPYPVGIVEGNKGPTFTNNFTIHYSKKGTHIVPRYVENDK